MSEFLPLHELFERSALRRPDHPAIEDGSGGVITYRAASALSDQLRDRLVQLDVMPGDRVGVYLTKSIDAVATILGVLKTGAAYVPVDPHAPVSRNAFILADCRVRVVVVEAKFANELERELEKAGRMPTLIIVEGTGGGEPLATALEQLNQFGQAPRVRSYASPPDALAYILYTSGSTGRPKGVMLSQRAACAFVDWCSETFRPTDSDRFSSHAPFHFDLSILDIYVPLKHGATLVLFGYELGRDPVRLAPAIADKRITVWYSAPSILSLLAQLGELQTFDYSSLRTVLFAGEVFPVTHLRALKQLLPHPRYYNLYGPTETNVCTFYEVPTHIPADRTDPYPIGQTCSHLRARVVDSHGIALNDDSAGELCISGPAVMDGYWGLTEQTTAAFLSDDDGTRWYKTGDVVTLDDQGDYLFRGRRDRMVKKRGYRVELGEIEACLYRHPDFRQAAVIAVEDDQGVTIKAFVSTRDEKKPSLIALKRFCSKQLPLYMVPDQFSFHASLPTTSTDKIDYQALKDLE